MTNLALPQYGAALVAVPGAAHAAPATVAGMALALARAGISAIPIAADGSKRPLVRWSTYQGRAPTTADIVDLFRPYPGCGLAIIGGAVSGRINERVSAALEIIDFDEPALIAPWRARVEEACPGLLARLVAVRTPAGGAHYYYRHTGDPEGNQKLAQELCADDDGRPRPHTLIETRGEGGYAIAPPSPPPCHPTGRPYRLARGRLDRPPTINTLERVVLLGAAEELTRYTPPPGPAPVPTSGDAPGGRPGDAYNARADWRGLLEPHGWTVDHARGGETFWRRPGKRDGQSATTGYDGRVGVLYVFSSNAYPFEPGRGYTPFTAYALLERGGDFRAAAAALAAQGYGEDRATTTTMRRDDLVDVGDLPAPRYVGAWRRRVAAVALPSAPAVIGAAS